MARPINETERQERIAMVDSVVNQLRAVGEKITRRKIAEGIGVTEQYLNSKDRHGNRNYLTEYVDSIIEAENRQSAEEVGDIMTYAALLEQANKENEELRRKNGRLQRKVDSLGKENDAYKDQIRKLQVELKELQDSNDSLLVEIHKLSLARFQEKLKRID